MNEPSNAAAVLTYDPQPAQPILRPHAGAADCHVHVFGPTSRFAYAAERAFTPVDALTAIAPTPLLLQLLLVTNPLDFYRFPA